MEMKAGRSFADVAILCASWRILCLCGERFPVWIRQPDRENHRDSTEKNKTRFPTGPAGF